MNNEKIKENEERICELLYSTKRRGMENLIEHMKKYGFFTAPCSGQYHLSEEGGLAEHSLNVYEYADKLADAFSYKNKESLIISSILHDLGKMGMYGKPNYVPNYVRSKKKNPETGDYDIVVSEAKPYSTNKDLLYIPHEMRSLEIAETFIYLKEEEAHAIFFHNGKYTHTGYDLTETPLQMIIHFADLWVSRTVEV